MEPEPHGQDAFSEGSVNLLDNTGGVLTRAEMASCIFRVFETTYCIALPSA